MPEPENSNGLPNPPDRQPLNDLFSLVYEDLKQSASLARRGESSGTVTTTALVHEAWLKLKDSHQLAGLSQAHFKSIAAHAIRQILVDAARRRKAQKRGGGEVAFVTLSNAPAETASSVEEILALHEALEELKAFSPRQAQMIECRFFGGLTGAETAEALGVSESAIERDWRAARAWLNGRLQSRKE
jgi:RNA polymerase sigma factor (TIGR02999 family)